jgi:hypothetical protein
MSTEIAVTKLITSPRLCYFADSARRASRPLHLRLVLEISFSRHSHASSRMTASKRAYRAAQSTSAARGRPNFVFSRQQCSSLRRRLSMLSTIARDRPLECRLRRREAELPRIRLMQFTRSDDMLPTSARRTASVARLSRREVDRISFRTATAHYIAARCYSTQRDGPPGRRLRGARRSNFVSHCAT